MRKLLLVHGQLCGLTDLPALIVVKGNATTSSLLLEMKIFHQHIAYVAYYLDLFEEGFVTIY
ncbi:hypothetical protein RHGRI_025095 [Rhododendron griersonianum]|uniref:Uncharacterized protein n=1 Tax=Rhododendron griersonianum TaxID=479676 RepID=A0AAV6JF83_9ERIC|nr:hypothetical protein RHGRI_025095 [Rhododendron griersonianum]